MIKFINTYFYFPFDCSESDNSSVSTSVYCMVTSSPSATTTPQASSPFGNLHRHRGNGSHHHSCSHHQGHFHSSHHHPSSSTSSNHSQQSYSTHHSQVSSIGHRSMSDARVESPSSYHNHRHHHHHHHHRKRKSPLP